MPRDSMPTVGANRIRLLALRLLNAEHERAGKA
jgi:hypothetical protein